jgi:hypothetical protein
MTNTLYFRSIVRLAAPLAAAWLAVASQATAQPPEGSFERALTVTGSVDLNIRAGSGQIRVHPGSANTVRVAARLRAGNSWLRSGDVEARIRQIERNPPIEQQGNVIRIGRFADDDLHQNISISYDVTVPADTKLEARTGSGSLDIGEIKGPVDASSGSGGITIGRIAGAVVASAGSGNIEVEGAASLSARTGSGDVRAGAVAGPTTARSGSGSIRIAQAGKGDVEVSASSGGVTLTGVDGAAHVTCSSGSIEIDGRPTGPWSLDASSGGVTVGLPPDASFDLDARTSSGSIDSVHPVTVTGRIDKRKITGTVRGGGPLVEIHSSSGNIRIR